MRRSPMKPGTSTLKRSPMSRTGLHRAESFARTKKEAKSVKSLKSKQRAVTAAERAMWDRLASSGCIACHIEGRFNSYVSIHHIDGRTKPNCHRNVLPLCSGHHQDDGSETIAVHPWKAAFELRYGSQQHLLAMCADRLGVLLDKDGFLPV